MGFGATITLTSEQRAFFRENGFLTVEHLTTKDDLTQVRAIFDAQFERFVSPPSDGDGDGAPTRSMDRLVDGNGATKVQSLHDRNGRLVWAEILLPEVERPELTESLVFRNAFAIAAELFETDVAALHGWESSFTLRTGVARTAQYWHQDEALVDPGTDREMLTVWVPLHDSTLDTGTMHFVPGTHNGEIYEHQTGPGKRPGVIGNVDPATTVSCPLAAGGATVHHQRTLHGTNLGTRQRCNYIIRVHRRPVTTRVTPHRRPWYPELPAQPDILRLDDFRDHLSRVE